MSQDTPPDWDAVFDEQIGRIYNYFLYRINQRETAEDLTAETFERAWANRKTYDPTKGNITGWLFGIAKHVLAAHFRQQSPGALSIHHTYSLHSAHNTEQIVQQRLTASELGKALQQLPMREQELIALKYGADMTKNRTVDSVK